MLNSQHMSTLASYTENSSTKKWWYFTLCFVDGECCVAIQEQGDLHSVSSREYVYPTPSFRGQQWRKLYCARKWNQPIASLRSCHDVCHLQYTNFVLQLKNAANKLRLWTGVHEILLSTVMKCVRMMNNCSYGHKFSWTTFNSLRKNLAWWAITQRTLQHSLLQHSLHSFIHFASCHCHVFNILVARKLPKH